MTMLEAFVKERNEALFSLDRKKIEAYMIKYGETEIAQTPDVVFWASVYKAICGIKDAPEAIVNKATAWLHEHCALPGFVDSKNEEKTERNAGYLVVSQSGGGMLRQGTRKGIRRTPANRGMRAHWVVKGLDISEDVCHGMCP